jgi:peptidoglycan/LPS O-acetylase OafA/YrhL
VKLGYRPALDGVRAIAISAVVSMHAFGWPGEGALGVDLFFVLSGFLITTLLLEEQQSRGRISLVGFYWRRARRLLPALFAMLAVYLAATVVVLAVRGELDAFGGRLLAVAATLGYVGNVFRLDGHHVPASLSHLWSLAQEEQFYVLWPLALILLRSRPALLARLLVVAIAGVMVERAALMSTHGFERVYLGPDAHSEPILIGCLFAVWFVEGRRPSTAVRGRVAAVSLAAIVATMTLLKPATKALSVSAAGWLYGTPLLTLFAFACGFLIFDGALEGSRVGRALSVKPLGFLGRISYALYLWHVPVLVAFGRLSNGGVRAVAAIAVAIGLAWASRYLIELPARRLRLPSLATSAPKEEEVILVAAPVWRGVGAGGVSRN